jgi:hypothetical protein
MFLPKNRIVHKLIKVFSFYLILLLATIAKGSLRLLTAVASQGAASTREVHTRFNISQPSFLKLMHRGIRKRSKDDEDAPAVAIKDKDAVADGTTGMSMCIYV